MQGAVPAAPTMKDFEDSPAGGGKVDGWRLAEGPKTEVPAYNPEVHPSYAAPPPPPPLLFTITAPDNVHIVGLEEAAGTGKVGEGTTALRGPGLRRLHRRLRTMT